MKHHCHINKDLPSSPIEIFHSLKEWIQIVSEKEEKVIIILDGFDNIDCESM
jgi:hypothetical protein